MRLGREELSNLNIYLLGTECRQLLLRDDGCILGPRGFAALEG